MSASLARKVAIIQLVAVGSLLARANQPTTDERKEGREELPLALGPSLANCLSLWSQ